MTDAPAEPPIDPHPRQTLNPALKQEKDTTHDLERTRGPLESTEARENEGEGWPIVWAVVTIVCVVITLYLFF